MPELLIWGWGLSALAGLGVVALLIQWAALVTHRRSGDGARATDAGGSVASTWAAPAAFAELPSFSLFKPLCGLDEDLAANLQSFVELDYPHERYEVLLGVRSAADPAYPLARELAQRHPGRFRCVLQQGEPGLNPKVNQLITLQRRARFAIWVVSDSNVRVPSGYLREMAEYFADPSVGCVTHPVAGVGARSLGAQLDNLHLGASVGPGMVAAQRVMRRDLVVGKSMAMRRDDVRALGGFFCVKDILAEDHILGNRIGAELGKRVVISRTPVWNVAAKKSVIDFFRRYRRWAVIHRTAVTPATYFAQALMNPLPLAVLGWALSPSQATLAFALGVGAAKAALDLACVRSLGARVGGIRGALAVPLKDALLFAAWLHGLFARTVDWRGNRLRVHAGSRLLPLDTATGAPAFAGAVDLAVPSARPSATCP